MSAISRDEMLCNGIYIEALRLLHNKVPFIQADDLFWLLNDDLAKLSEKNIRRRRFSFDRLLDNLWAHGFIERCQLPVPDYFEFPSEPVNGIANDLGMDGSTSSRHPNNRLDYEAVSEATLRHTEPAKVKLLELVYVYSARRIQTGFTPIAPSRLQENGGEFSWDKTMFNWTREEYLTPLHATNVFMHLHRGGFDRQDCWDIHDYPIWDIREFTNWDCKGREDDGWRIHMNYGEHLIILFFCGSRANSYRLRASLGAEFPEASRIYFF